MQEFRLATVIKLPDDEFDRAKAVVQCGEFKGAVAKLLTEHKLTGTVTHEIVTPRGAKEPASPAAPPAPAGTTPGTVADVKAAMDADADRHVHGRSGGKVAA